MTDYALCRTCPEVATGRIDSSKGWQLSESSNHNNCDVKPFTDLTTLPGPIRNLILRLGAGAPVRDIDITMFKLGLYLEDAWTPFPSTVPAAINTSTPSFAPVRQSVVSTKLQRALPPTPITSAPSDQGVLDFGGDAA